ncbi:hypothetical protein EYF80_005929 [Liparis tanakae]|uniref:Uncharacterized protein n=1 Tax=Liparis tanakae TaxID=230148 RepID=A0A4Z2J2P3_9TELE|nr:hypothetical protein EYF80_005929 [Liparis tanakae]
MNELAAPPGCVLSALMDSGLGVGDCGGQRNRATRGEDPSSVSGPLCAFVLGEEGAVCMRLQGFSQSLWQRGPRGSPWTGLVMELSPLGWQHTIQQPLFLEV